MMQYKIAYNAEHFELLFLKIMDVRNVSNVSFVGGGIHLCILGVLCIVTCYF